MIFFKKHKKFSLQDVPLAEYVVFCIKALLLFTLITIILSIFNIVIPDTLISCFFAAFGGEFLVCGLIKVFKIKSTEAPQEIIQEGSVAAIGFDMEPNYEEELEIDQSIIGFKTN